MILLLSFAFLSGLITILTPCIWPILPIILSSSVVGKGHHRPLGITLGIIISFAFFTLALSSLIRIFHFDPNALHFIAVIVIGFLGITFLIPALSHLMELILSRMSSIFGQRQQGKGFAGGFITGLSLGIVWSPCAGPILAAIAALAASGKVNAEVVAITVAYIVGVGIPLFMVAYGGQLVIAKTRFISSHTESIQKIFGVIMILTALAIYTNYDVYLESKFLNAFPFFNSLANVGNSNDLTKQLNILKRSSAGQNTQGTPSGLFNSNSPAPDFVGITKWLGTDKSISIKGLKGKVVLVDFWTYTCINCIRTLPHVTSWYQKYKDQGFVVIGVHTPEFQFEHETQNVQNAIKLYNIQYPVAQDNNYATWNNYANQYWPAEYLIDANGIIRRTHFGEGEYDQMEQAIQLLLKENGKKVTNSLDSMPNQTPTTQLSPETYIGAKRMEFYYPTGSTGVTNQDFILQNPTENSFSLGGQWDIQDENGVTGQNAVLVYNFYASKVFLVLRPGTAGADARVKVLLDGKLIDSSAAGSDVNNGIVTIDSDRLYNLVDLKGNTGNHILRLEFQSPGIQVFAFTFG